MVWDEDEFDFSASFWNNVNSAPVGSTLHELAIGAKGLIGGAESTEKVMREFTAALMLINSIQFTGGILYKFANEIEII